jgi:hypothetical protein
MNFVTALNTIRPLVWTAVGVLIVFRILSRWIAVKAAEESTLMQLVNATNAMKSNSLAIVCMVCGGFLICCGDKEDGRLLVTGAFALFQHEAKPTSPLAPNAPQVSNQ